MDKLLHDALDAFLAFVAGLVPSALGAIVTLIYEPGLTWLGRFTQLWVGITVSYFSTRAAGAIYPFHPYVLQALGFVVGMIAFKAAPAFVAGCVAVIAELPGQLRDRLLALLPRKEKK